MDPSKNTQEFIKKYGKEGFLELFLTNYFFELIQYFLHSELRVKEDLKTAYYSNFKGVPYKKKDIEEFEKKIKEECNLRAKLVVRQLKSNNLLEKIAKEPNQHPEVDKEVTKSLKEILKTISSGF
jgi:hypothetical protein